MSSIQCIGFASVQEANECTFYECQDCACSRLAKTPIVATSTTLIVLPYNLIGQVSVCCHRDISIPPIYF